jgi:hypothetical protein
MKSGYHGGASPAEVVVPVTILVPGAVPDEAAERLRLAPPQAPAWWLDPAAPTAASADSAAPSVSAPPADRARSRPAPDLRKRPDETALTLFDELNDAARRSHATPGLLHRRSRLPHRQGRRTAPPREY